MKYKLSIIILSIILIVFLGAIIYVIIKMQQQETITDFQLCAAAGYPIMESYPRQCKTADGKTFVEVIPDTGEKQYISTNQEQCKLIKFFCADDKKPFFDNKGCGCETNDAIENGKKTYCMPEQRETDFCIQIYEPVCGWFDSAKIQCVTYPCAETFSNSCVACSNENVLYWTEEECPQ